MKQIFVTLYYIEAMKCDVSADNKTFTFRFHKRELEQFLC